MANAVGRPQKLTDEQKEEVLEALKLYVDRTADPTIVGFCSWDDVPLKYDVSDDNIYDWKEFSGLRKRAIQKQEAYLLQAGGTGKFNPTMAIFRLKQPVHGYTDRNETDLTSKGEKINAGINLDETALNARLSALVEGRQIGSDTVAGSGTADPSTN